MKRWARFVSLFAGIGGLELGLERAFRRAGVFAWTGAQVEIDPFCRSVLERHWPHAERFDDVRTVRGLDLGTCDVLCGGFPCQDVSVAGKGGGLAGERSGLWREFARCIREIRPAVVVVENVTALRSRGLDDVLGDLASSGYYATWDCVPARAIGAPHDRERIFVVAWHVSDAHGEAVRIRAERDQRQGRGVRTPERWNPEPVERSASAWRGAVPELHRVANGVSAGLDEARIRALGNAVVPQVAERVGDLAVEVWRQLHP